MTTDTPELPAHLTSLSRPQYRQEQRLPDSYTAQSPTELSFDPRLAFELALQMEQPGEVFARYGLTGEQAKDLILNPAFQKTLKEYTAEVKEKGVSFRMRAKVMAEDLLSHAYDLATDPEMPPSVRADLIKWAAKVADLEPKADKVAGGGTGFGVQIVFSGSTPAIPQAVTVQQVPDVLTLENT